MTKEDTSSKMLTIILAIIISIAAIVFLYVNLPQDKTEDETGDGGTKDGDTGDSETEEPEVVLTVTYNDTDYQYTFSEIENLSFTTGTARYLKASPFKNSGTIIIKPPMNETANQYMGVEISTILEDIDNLPDTYNLTLSAPDGYDTIFSNTEIEGDMITYNETGNETNAEVSVILAYKQDGEHLPEEDGTLRVAIVGDEPISLSNRWVSNVVLIEVIEI